MIERVMATIPRPRDPEKAAFRDTARAAVIMAAVLAAAEKGTGDPHVAMFAVVLVLVEDTVGSLASLLRAAEIAAEHRQHAHPQHLRQAAVRDCSSAVHRARELWHLSVGRIH
jgi:hypothetical protein